MVCQYPEWGETRTDTKVALNIWGLRLYGKVEGSMISPKWDIGETPNIGVYLLCPIAYYLVYTLTQV